MQETPKSTISNQSTVSSQHSQPLVERQMNETPVKSSQAHKTKFVPLFSPDGKDRTIVQIPGR